MSRTVAAAALLAILGATACVSPDSGPPGTVWIDGRGQAVRADGGGPALDAWELHPTVVTSGFTSGGVLYWQVPDLVVLRHRDQFPADAVVRRTDVPYRRTEHGSAHRFVRLRGREAEWARSELAAPATGWFERGEGAGAERIEVPLRDVHEIRAR